MAGVKQPTDKSHFILPDLGEGVHEAELIKWKVKEGEIIKEHQTIAEMETDKALVEVPSPWSGKIKTLRGNEGEIINVGSVLVEYDISSSIEHRDHKETNPTNEERIDEGTVVGKVSDSNLTMPKSMSRKDTFQNSKNKRKNLATPAIRRIAKELGIDLDQVEPSGRGGRITATDVHNYATGESIDHPKQAIAKNNAESIASKITETIIDARKESFSALENTFTSNQNTPIERIPFRGVRRKIAQALHHSVQTTVHFTVTEEVDITLLEKKRRNLEKISGLHLSTLPFIMLACTKALKKHPQLNSTVDDESGEILRYKDVNLGCAVDTDHGLMVPVIQRAAEIGLFQFANQTKNLANQCRERSIERQNLDGGTFTISNVGSYGGLHATPVINYPQVAILAVGRSREKVLTKDGAIYPGIMLPLSLSCDHRVVDGAEGARFLETIKNLLQKPDFLIDGE